jgi:hypothetical protein
MLCYGAACHMKAVDPYARISGMYTGNFFEK